MFFKKGKRQNINVNNKKEKPDAETFEVPGTSKGEAFEKSKRKRPRIVFELSKKSIVILFLFALLLIFLFWVLNHPNSLKGFVSGAFSVLSPIILGLVFAFIINIPLRAVEGIYDRIFKKKKSSVPGKIKRPVCLTLSIILILAFLFTLVFMVLPGFTSSYKTIVNSVPKYVEKIESWWDSIILFAKDFGAVIPDLNIDANKLTETLGGLAGNVFGSMFVSGGAIVSHTMNFTASVLSWIANTVIAFVFALYILASKEKLLRNIKSTLFAYLPEKKVVRMLEVARLTNKTFFSFATGQLTEAIIIGVLCFAGMKIFSLPHASVVSVIIGVTALIPVFGAYVGTILGAFLILLVSPLKALWFVIFIIVLQQLESNIIYPRVVGDSVGLPAMWVMVCVVLGGEIFGIWGMLLSVPVCAVLYVLLRAEVYERIGKKRKTNIE